MPICVLQKSHAVADLGITLICMNASTSSSRKVGLVPSIFFGSPVSLVVAGLLMQVLPAAGALALGLVVGTAAGRVILKSI